MDNAFFWTSKLAWLLISPDSIILMWLFIGVLLLILGKIILSKYILISLSITLTLIALFPFGKWLAYPLETQYKHNPDLTHVDGIIVLSGSENAKASHILNQLSFEGAVERILYFVILANQHPNAKLIFTGGSSDILDNSYKSADVAKIFLDKIGFDTSRVIFERMSRNTYENVIYSQQLVKPKQNETWVLITSALHMPRAMDVFCKKNWPITAFPVDFNTIDSLYSMKWSFSKHLKNLVHSSKEWVGIMSYKLTGKSC